MQNKNPGETCSILKRDAYMASDVTFSPVKKPRQKLRRRKGKGTYSLIVNLSSLGTF